MLKSMKILNNFAVLEGGDGSGTTTQLAILEQTLSEGAAANPEHVSPLPAIHKTFEPTDNPAGRLIRQGLKGEIRLKSETIAFLFAADRNEHIYGPQGIMERCGRGELVVSDRYLFSSLVYQGITCGEELPARLNRDFPLPELVIFFDLDPKIAEKRIQGRSQKEIYETLEFQIKVRESYQSIFKKYGSTTRVEIIDASLSKEEVSREIWRAFSKMPIFKG